MDNTQRFVQKFTDNQKKSEKNKRSGHGNEGNVLPGKQHSTNK